MSKFLSPGLETFKIETVSFLEEWFNAGTQPKIKSALHIPFQIFLRYLARIMQRCSELNDPVLNKIMCDMALYEQASKYSKEYDKEMVEEVDRLYNKYSSNNECNK